MDKNFEFKGVIEDGVSANKDKELVDPQGFGRIEYAYYCMAIDCGIEMMESRLLEENTRAHFMTKRFDRSDGGDKFHMQSLCALGHYDFNMAGACSYEQALEMVRRIVKQNTKQALEQQFLRAVFNIVGRNQDDHTKNIDFLMDRHGNWRPSPAYDMAYSFNPNGEWTSKHQMSLNGKREAFTREDLIKFGEKAELKKAQALKLIHKVEDVFSNWRTYAKKCLVFTNQTNDISKNIRKLVD